MVHKLALLLFGISLAAGAASRGDTLDPAFEGFPFDRWLGEHSDGHFHWKARVAPAVLTFHQRLVTAIGVQLDGADLEARRGKSKLLFLAQVTDGQGTRYQHHAGIDLSKLEENVKALSVDVSQPAFFLPGDYHVALAIVDTASGEHSTTQLQFRVTPPPNVLRDAWGALPAVEFIDSEQSPESWYLPEIQGRLQWAAAVHSAVRLNVILNVAASGPGARRIPSGGLSALLPTLKVLGETGSPLVSETVNLLDLARRRDAFSQSDGKELDWPRLKSSLGEANTASIDVHSLEERHHDAQFFLSEVRKALRGSDKPSVLVVLTTPVEFESGEDLEPISVEALPPCRVIYIRYRGPARVTRPVGPGMGGRGRGGRGGGGMPRGAPSRYEVDQLEATLKPLHPKVFDVETPADMTKALEEVRNSLLNADAKASQ